MAKLLVSSRVSSFSHGSTGTIAATINVPKIRVTQICTPRLPVHKGSVAKLNLDNCTTATTIATEHIKVDPFYSSINTENSRAHNRSTMEVDKLHMIMEIVADRAEMHKNIGAQRDNWNRLLLTSINMMTLSAATMAGMAAISATASSEPLLALKVSSTILYMVTTGILLVMNKIQPSQLAEEQRNAARLFKMLNGELKTKLSLGDPTESDVNEAMEKILALDRAYPLPLLGTMLDKFPQTVEPAVWWPQLKRRHQRQGEWLAGKMKGNGWDARLEEELKEVISVLKKKDMADYLRLSKLVLNLNKVLAISGPLLTGLAALGSAFLGSTNVAWPVMLAIIGGALASAVNTLEHGGQLGMVFELYRGASGFFKLMEETVELNIKEPKTERRENGELLEMKVALQLGRSLSDLRQFAALSSSDKEKAFKEFASKLF